MKTMSNGMFGTKIVDWCTNAIRSSFLGVQVGRTKGGDYVYYLMLKHSIAISCFVLLCQYRDGDTRVLLLRGINGRLIFVGIVCGVYMQGTASKTSFKV